MALLQTDIPEQLNIKLKIYKAKWQQPTLGHAAVHALERFFDKFDDDWILKANEEIEDKDDPDYVKKI